MNNKDYTPAEVDAIYANIKKRFDYLKTVPSKVMGRYFFVSAPLKEKITKDESTGVETRELLVDKANCRTVIRRGLGRPARKHEAVM